MSAFTHDLKRSQSDILFAKMCAMETEETRSLDFGPWDKQPVEICGNVSFTLLIGTCT